MKRRTRNQAINHAWLLLTAESPRFKPLLSETRHDEVYAHNSGTGLGVDITAGIGFTKYSKLRIMAFATGFLRDFFAKGGTGYRVLAEALSAQQPAMRAGALIAMNVISDYLQAVAYPKTPYYGYNIEEVYSAFLELAPWMRSDPALLCPMRVSLHQKDEKPQ
jgi:hypothetical protein